MKQIILFILPFLFFAGTTQAQRKKITPEKVIVKYWKALGGKKKLEAIQNITIENTMTTEDITILGLNKKMGNKFFAKQTVMDVELMQVFDGENGYTNQMGDRKKLTPEEVERYKTSKTIEALELDPNHYKSVLIESINGKNYYVLAKGKDKNYFDVKTGLLTFAKSDNVETEIKEYTTVDGIKFRQLTLIKANGKTVEVRNTKITTNTNINENDFK